MKKLIVINPELYEAIELYAKQKGQKSWSKALLELARIGYVVETKQAAPIASKAWGGKR